MANRISHQSDEVAEWLRRRTANPMCSARVGSNPILVDIPLVFCKIHLSFIPMSYIRTLKKNNMVAVTRIRTWVTTATTWGPNH